MWEIREEEPREVDYTVCALVEVPYAMTFRYSGSGYDTILPAEPDEGGLRCRADPEILSV